MKSFNRSAIHVLYNIFLNIFQNFFVSLTNLLTFFVFYYAWLWMYWCFCEKTSLPKAICLLTQNYKFVALYWRLAVLQVNNIVGQCPSVHCTTLGLLSWILRIYWGIRWWPHFYSVAIILFLTLRLLSADGPDINYLYQCTVSRRSG